MNDDHPSRELLAAFDRGTLASADQSEVERHVPRAPLLRGAGKLADDDLVVLIKSSAATPVVSESTAYGETAGRHAAGPGSRGESSIAAGARPADRPPALSHHQPARQRRDGRGVRAEHRIMERPVALKILNPELVERPGAVQRFRQEIKAASQLTHPNIVTAYDADQAGEVHFLVMELVEGKSLDKQIEPGRPVAVADACSWICQAAWASHAHERGMVHRDIKPANLMLAYTLPASGGRKPSVDTRRLQLPRGAYAPPRRTRRQNSRLRPGAVRQRVRCPASLMRCPASWWARRITSPEQRGDPRRADVRADIYSLGCTLYHLLSGRVPHPADTVLQKLMAHEERRPGR